MAAQQQQAGEGEELPGTQRGSLGDVLSVEFVVSDTPPAGPDDTPQLRFEVCMALLRCGAFLGGTAGTVWAVLGTEGAIAASRADGRPGFGYADVELELEARDYRVWLLPAVLPGTVPVRAAMPYVLREPPKHVQPVVEQSCFDPAAPLRARQAVIHGLREIEPRGLPVVAPGQLGELACALAENGLEAVLRDRRAGRSREVGDGRRLAESGSLDLRRPFQRRGGEGLEVARARTRRGGSSSASRRRSDRHRVSSHGAFRFSSSAYSCMSRMSLRR